MNRRYDGAIKAVEGMKQRFQTPVPEGAQCRMCRRYGREVTATHHLFNQLCRVSNSFSFYLKFFSLSKRLKHFKCSHFSLK